MDADLSFQSLASSDDVKIWISYDSYIRVNKDGYVQGPCFEGMLGCVLQVQKSPGNADPAPAEFNGTGEGSAGTTTLAIKIPRLLADTIEENAYICKLTEYEQSSVTKIEGLGGNVAGLFPAEIFSVDPLRRPRATQYSSDPEAVAQRGHVIFVSFERDHKPRFCTVTQTATGFDVIPAGCLEDFTRNVKVDDWKNFLSDRSRTPSHFLRAVYSHESKQIRHSGFLEDALEARETKVWYGALPSVVFRWAGGNLQESVTKREIGGWKLPQQFGLFEQILGGLGFLHEHGMIHGDVRPANIMWLGSSEAANYRLGDYGSYGREWQAVARQETGHTMVGPAIGQRRHAVFYSPERRAGNEFESADTAVIIKNERKGALNYAIVLGWRSTLLENGAITAKTRESLVQWATSDNQTSAGDKSSLDKLQPGDRLRLRNYLFEVLASEMAETGEKLFLCSGRYAEVLHDSLVVYKNCALTKTETILDISNYVEFHQWSAASDLFSFGAVCLYTLFHTGLQRPAPKDHETHVTDSTEPGDRETLENEDPLPSDRETQQNEKLRSKDRETDGIENPDRLFLEMIEALESVKRFNFLWDELEAFRYAIEDEFTSHPSSEEAINRQVAADSSDELKRTLIEMAKNATNNILKVTPHAEFVLRTFDHNLAYFLLFMHFVLACLHRQSHVRKDIYDKVAKRQGFLLPFAADRVEAPQQNGAAAKASARLQVIGTYLRHPFFSRFTVTEDELTRYDPRSDFMVRIHFDELQREYEKLKAEKEDLKEERQRLHRKNLEKHHQNTQLDQNNAKLKKEQRDLRQEYERLEQKYQKIERQLDLLSEQHNRAVQMAATLKKVPRLAISSRRQQIEALLAFLDGDANQK